MKLWSLNLRLNLLQHNLMSCNRSHTSTTFCAIENLRFELWIWGTYVARKPVINLLSVKWVYQTEISIKYQNIRLHIKGFRLLNRSLIRSVLIENIPIFRAIFTFVRRAQGCDARKVDCGRVYSAYILKPVLFGRNL